MVDILICGDLSDRAPVQTLLPALAARGGVCFSGCGDAAESGTTARFFVCESETVPNIGVPKGILMFKERIAPCRPAGVPEGFLCVMNSGNAAAAGILRGSGAAVVACGTGAKDTLSFSSLESDRAAVSLQRGLRTLSGAVLEPRDFPVSFPGFLSPDTVLLVCAVLLLADADPDRGFSLSYGTTPG